MRNIHKLIGARQAQYGIETDSPTGWVTLRDAGFGDLVLSVEVGSAGEVVGHVATDATVEAQYDALCRLEGFDWSWVREQERHRLLNEAEEQGDLTSRILAYDDPKGIFPPNPPR